MATAGKQVRGQGQVAGFPRLLGGRLCLHFVNTVEGPNSDHPTDFLHTYDDIARWGRHAGTLKEDELARLIAVAESRPAEAEAVYRTGIALREAVEDVFRAVARDEPPPASALGALQEHLAEAVANARLVPADGAYAWSWDHNVDDLRKPLWLVASSANELLTEGDLGRVKECPGAADCGWLFYDESKNGRRRWCSMEGCGSRVKMRRQYARRATDALR